jgi:hypothetical protein
MVSSRRRVLNAVLDVAALPAVVVLPHRTVEVDGVRVPLHYELRRWAWRSERCVEIALASRALGLRNPRSVVEIGNVLPLAGISCHTVVDKYEQGPGVLNEDVVDFRPEQRFDLLVSLSTLEHIGWDEQPQDPGKAARALEAMSRLADDLLVTIPVGYHPTLDAHFADGLFDSVVLLRKRSRIARWEPAPLDELEDVRYGTPYFAANGLLVGLRGAPLG